MKKIIIIVGVLFGMVSLSLAQNLINDGSFELGTPNAEWTETSTNFGTPICDIFMCGTGLGTGPHTGDYWAWFGGIAAVEIGSIDQTITIPNGTAELRFWLEIPLGEAADYLEVQIDDNPIFIVYGDNTGYNPYTEVVLDISTYADGGNHKIEFYSECFGSGTTNFFVDDVSVEMTTPPDVPLTSSAVVIALLLISFYGIYQFRNRNQVINS